jgi:subtilisin family serine protease
MKTYIISLLSIFFLIGCGGGGGGSSSPDSHDQTEQNVTATLIDSGIGGVSYSCGTIEDTTNSDGQFSCQENSTVSFTIGGVILGNILINSETNYVTPAVLYGLENNNTTDIRILNFIQFVQSLDDDNDPDNGIFITQTIRDALSGTALDISNANTTQSDINNTLISIGKILVPQEDALVHYKNTLRDTLNVILEDEPYYSQQWYLHYNETMYSQNSIDENAHIHPEEFLKTYSGKGIKIAIIDDGLDTNHEDLYGSIINTYTYNYNNFSSSDVSHSNSSDNHGTAVTGIIGARINGKGIHGIANRSDIIFLKLQEFVSDSEFIELFNKAEEFGADIINCSWGTTDVSTAVKEKIQDLATNGRNGKGTIIVFASGNHSADMGNDESAIPEVIAVGATDKDNFRAYYSNFGENLDLVAPGGTYLGITTLDPTDADGVATVDSNYLLYNDPSGFVGTSASAPIVSGAIALMLEKDPTLTRTEIETLLRNTSDKIGTLPYVDGRNNYYGYGKLNLTNIFNSL